MQKPSNISLLFMVEKEIKLNYNTKLCAVVKANAYGHGVEEVAANLVKQGVDYFAVAFIDEDPFLI